LTEDVFVTAFFIGHLDFVFLIYGLAFFLLAMVAFSMAQIREQGVSWIWLGLFAIVHGFNEWVGMVLPALGEPAFLTFTHSVLLVLSFLFLFEFGRRNVVWAGVGRAGWWIYVPSLCLLGAVAVRFGHFGLLSTARYVLAFPGGLLAAIALWQWGAPLPGGGRNFRHWIAPMAMVGYATLSGLVAPKVDFGLAAFFNTEFFLSATGIPVQLLRCGAVCTIALIIWHEHFIWRMARFSGTAIKWIMRLECLAIVVVLMILISGFVMTEKVQHVAQGEARVRLLDLGRLIVAAINPERVMHLSGIGADFSGPDYTRLRDQCQYIADSSSDIRSLSLMRRVAGKIQLLLEVEPSRYRGVSDFQNACSGEVCPNVLAGVTRVFESGTGVSLQQIQSNHGEHFVSAYLPITEPESGRVLVVLGVDQADTLWGKALLQKRLTPLLVTALLSLLMMTFTIIWLRIGEESELRNISMVIAQRQQDALWKLVDSEGLGEGSLLASWQRTTEEVGRVIRADQVWIISSIADKAEFLTEDRFDLARGLHVSGEIFSGENSKALKAILDEGRTLAVSDVVSDDSIPGLKELCVGLESRAALFAPFKPFGKVGGVLVFSQTGLGRKWSSDEVRFAFEVASLVSRSLVNRERDRSEKALSKAHDELEVRVRERTEQLFLKNKQLKLEIEERKRIEAEHDKLEAQVRQAQKLESLGVMAGGIAHDFNNILMAILGNAELAKLETPPGTPAIGYIRDIETAANRAASLSSQMLAYSGRGHSQIHAVDLNAMVREMVGILEVSVSKKVTILYSLDEALKTLDGDSSQIGQIVMNLVINAAEAIGDSVGVITLQTGTIWCDAGMLASLWMNETMPEGEYVYIEVRDTGCGMEQGILSRIFDPFFTTKFTGRGLGLAAVLGIVRGHHGTIDVCSEKGHGTTFRVLFPVGRLTLKSLSRPAEMERCLGHGAILLADDEEPVRELGLKFIERLGYRAVAAVDGIDAVEKYRQNQADIRCVLMDLTMPQCDGHEALLELRKLNPEVKVILCSGYIKEDVMSRFEDWGLAGFLQKPYGFEAMAVQVQATLRAVDQG
jgi:signal transduction histidine kinase/ActR/RegA family two-component response regulator